MLTFIRTRAPERAVYFGFASAVSRPLSPISRGGAASYSSCSYMFGSQIQTQTCFLPLTFSFRIHLTSMQAPRFRSPVKHKARTHDGLAPLSAEYEPRWANRYYKKTSSPMLVFLALDTCVFR